MLIIIIIIIGSRCFGFSWCRRRHSKTTLAERERTVLWRCYDAQITDGCLFAKRTSRFVRARRRWGRLKSVVTNRRFRHSTTSSWWCRALMGLYLNVSTRSSCPVLNFACAKYAVNDGSQQVDYSRYGEHIVPVRFSLNRKFNISS